MGWKDGQGLGPHLVRRKKKKKKAPTTLNPIKVYGCRLPGVTDSGSEVRKYDLVGSNAVENDALFLSHIFAAFVFLLC